MAKITGSAETRKPHKIKAWRTHRKMTQDQIADKLGQSVGNISQLESLSIGYTQDSLEALAAIFDCEPADLLVRDPTADLDPTTLVNSLSDKSRKIALSQLRALKEQDQSDQTTPAAVKLPIPPEPNVIELKRMKPGRQPVYLARWMEYLEVTPEELASDIGYPISLVRQFMDGDPQPNEDWVYELAQKLGVKPDTKLYEIPPTKAPKRPPQSNRVTRPRKPR